MIFLGILGLLFLTAGVFLEKVPYEFIGIGTWAAGMVYFVFKDHKEVVFFVSGLLILHSGIVLLLIDDLLRQELLGLLVFTLGVIVVLISGFSDYLKNRKKR